MHSKPVVLITGASRGLGYAMAEAFLAEGCQVVGASRQAGDSAQIDWVTTDVKDGDSRASLLSHIQEKYGRLDVLINNAGRGMYETMEASTEEDTRDLFELNVLSLIAMTRLCLPLLKQSKGTIINTDSVAGKMPIACMGIYCATKYAVAAISDTLRIELKPHGIHVINLIVGRIATGFSNYSAGGKIPPDSPDLGPAPTAAGLAKAVIKAWKKRRNQVIYPFWYRLVILIPRIMPGLWARKNRRMWGLD